MDQLSWRSLLFFGADFKGRYHSLLSKPAVSLCRPKNATILDRAAFHPAHTPHPGLGGQLVQQRLGIFEVGGIEAFGEPVVDLREHLVRLVSMAVAAL